MADAPKKARKIKTRAEIEAEKQAMKLRAQEAEKELYEGVVEGDDAPSALLPVRKRSLEPDPEDDLPLEALDVPSGANIKVKFAPETVKEIERRGMSAQDVLARTKRVVSQEAVREGIKRILAANPSIKNLIIEIGEDGKPILYSDVPDLLRNAYRITHVPERQTKTRHSGEDTLAFHRKVELLAFEGDGHKRRMGDRAVLETLQRDDPKRYKNLPFNTIKSTLNVIRKRNPNRRAPDSKYAR